MPSNVNGKGNLISDVILLLSAVSKTCISLPRTIGIAPKHQFNICFTIIQALTALRALRRLDLQDNSFSNKAGPLLASSIRNQVRQNDPFLRSFLRLHVHAPYLKKKCFLKIIILHHTRNHDTYLGGLADESSIPICLTCSLP